MSLRVLDLFSGIGGFALAVRRSGVGRVVGYCELDPFCRAVLAARMKEGRIDAAPIYEDIRTFDATPLSGHVDLIVGGFPCQDISAAGKGAGLGGVRSGLWSEMLRCIRECRPSHCLIENVPALRTRGADRVLADLEEEGYTWTSFVVGAWAVGAPHRRDRVWIVGHAAEPRRDGAEGAGVRSEGLPLQAARSAEHGVRPVAHAGVDTLRDVEQRGPARRPWWVRDEGEAFSAGYGEVADAYRERLQRLWESESGGIEGSLRYEPDRCGVRGPGATGLADSEGGGVEGLRPEGIEVSEVPAEPEVPGRDSRGDEWPARPGEAQHYWEKPRLVEFPVGGAADGVPPGLVRARRRNNREALKAYGNAIVPAIAEEILRCMFP